MSKTRLRFFGLCLLPFGLLFLLAPWRGEKPVPRLNEGEADELLRRAASAALGGRDGAVVVMDPQTGRVRALVNGRLAFEGATPPGSAVKPFTLLAALGEGAVNEESRALCRGRYEREGFHLNCAHPRFKPPFGPAQALANSCNYFFGRTGESLDGRAFARTLTSFGFGSPTGGGGAEEAAGLLPPDTPGVPEMLGESERLQVTPAQLLTAYAAVFNGGHLLVPRAGSATEAPARERARVRVDPSGRALLLEGMRGAVSYGTAARAGLATLPVYVFGKTGTSTPEDGFRPQGWFVGLAADEKGTDEDPAPPDKVSLGVLVFLKRARGSEAAEVARPVFEEYARTLAPRAREGREEASPSSSTGGPVVRVRLARADRTPALPLEDYVFGVLAAEGSVETELEALKALAVAARTYALHNLGRHGRDRYDLCDTTHCQRFTRVPDESSRPDFYDLARRAVRETSGEVLRDSSGGAAESYFSASCGGATADAALLWGGAVTPAHLKGVRDESCEAAGWVDRIASSKLQKALAADERSDVGARLDSVRVLRRDHTGRAELIEVSGERRKRLRGWDFKIIVGRTLGWDVLKSSRFDVARSGPAFVFRGSGFGHGLGLCQSGAHRMAQRGASYRQILDKYMPGLPIADWGLRVADSPRAEAQPTAPTSEEVHYSPIAYSATRNPQSAIGGAHFRLVYPSGIARREVEVLMRALEAARADVLRRSEGTRLPGRIEVFVHETTGDFVGVTGQPAWAGGATHGSRIDLQPLEVLRRRGVLASTARHELVHVALESSGSGRAPRWLVEGLAIHAAGEGPLYARAAPKHSLTIDEIERGLARPASPEEMRALYAAAYREVLALVRREGESSVWRRAAR
ncbi:MAG TPA: SpoIID/LytB domain-containing protein [Pyrinomonadaceae bacterium]|jgi:stage II sporulation protein D|nr:SpoIID/LytB domain-containing protein [Pyrinomonadaceae bacterium]